MCPFVVFLRHFLSATYNRGRIVKIVKAKDSVNIFTPQSDVPRQFTETGCLGIIQNGSRDTQQASLMESQNGYAP